MNIIKLIFSTAILFSFSSHSYGVDWWLTHASKEKVVFIDIESIKDEGYEHKKIWVYFIYKDGSSSKILSSFKCKEEEHGIKATYSYKPDGSTGNVNSDEYVSYNPIAPETIGYDLLKITCSDEPKSQLTGEYQVELKDDMTPFEASKIIFESFKEEKKSPPKKKSMKPQS